MNTNATIVSNESEAVLKDTGRTDGVASCERTSPVIEHQLAIPLVDAKL